MATLFSTYFCNNFYIFAFCECYTNRLPFSDLPRYPVFFPVYPAFFLLRDLRAQIFDRFCASAFNCFPYCSVSDFHALQKRWIRSHKTGYLEKQAEELHISLVTDWNETHPLHQKGCVCIIIGYGRFCGIYSLRNIAVQIDNKALSTCSRSRDRQRFRLFRKAVSFLSTRVL